MTISKEELIEEITDQLKALKVIADTKGFNNVDQALALFDLQFRLKCKLYELTEGAEDNE